MLVQETKSVQDIRALLPKEQDLQKAQGWQMQMLWLQKPQKLSRMRDIRAAPCMHLCSTEEMMQVFKEYYEVDVQDMLRSTINNTNIQASVDVKEAEFDFQWQS